MYAVTPGEAIRSDGDNDSLDAIVESLLEEIYHRRDYIEDFRAYLQGAPLGNEFELNEEQGFNGLEQLRDMSRNNYAKLIVSATTDRLGIDGASTAAANDEFGDVRVAELFDRDDMGTRAQEAMSLACGYRTSYLYVDQLTKRQSVIPPTNAAVISDVSGEPVAAIVLKRERALQRDTMHVYVRKVNELTGEAEGDTHLFIATREIESYTEHISKSDFSQIKVTEHDSEIPLSHGIKSGWEWWKKVPVKVSRIPVTPLKDKDGENEFENYTDTIDRINHMIFQRVVIATMQAFRQRAISGDFPEEDPVTGAKIDYEAMFASGPAQMWTLPENAKMWESQPTQFQDITEAIKADERALAAQSYTPMNYLSDNVNLSAEGSSLQRENYISKIEDRRRRFGSRWARHLSILFETEGDTERSDVYSLKILWQPISTDSLTSKTAAFASLRSQGVAMRTAWRIAMGLTPQEIQKAEDERLEETLTQNLTSSINQVTPMKKSAYGTTATSLNAAKSNEKAPSKE